MRFEIFFGMSYALLAHAWRQCQKARRGVFDFLFSKIVAILGTLYRCTHCNGIKISDLYRCMQLYTKRPDFFEVEKWRDAWLKFDPMATGVLSAEDFVKTRVCG